MMSYAELFDLILDAEYTHGDKGTDYCITVDEGNRMVRILFQGSTTAEDWKHNFQFLPVKVKPYKDMPYTWYAHKGFVEMYKAVRDLILEQVENHDGYLFSVAGHSQGGAIAQLCAEDIAFHNQSVICTTFGSPRVFYGRKTRGYLSTLPIYYKDCFENGSDIVPLFPIGAHCIVDGTHIGERFCLLNVWKTAQYHMGYGDESLYG